MDRECRGVPILSSVLRILTAKCSGLNKILSDGRLDYLGAISETQYPCLEGVTQDTAWDTLWRGLYSMPRIQLSSPTTIVCRCLGEYVLYLLLAPCRRPTCTMHVILAGWIKLKSTWHGCLPVLRKTLANGYSFATRLAFVPEGKLKGRVRWASTTHITMTCCLRSTVYS